MKRYVLFLSTDQLLPSFGVELDAFTNQVFDTNMSKAHQINDSSETYFSFVSLDRTQNVECNDIDGRSDIHIAPTWGHLKVGVMSEKNDCWNYLLSQSHHCGHCISDVVRILHELCDIIERPGSMVEMFWLRVHDYDECVDNVELYGCIKRFQLQCNALVNIILTANTVNRNIHLEGLRPSVCTLTEAVSDYQRPFWNGSILLTGCTQPSLLLLGFRMDSCLLGNSSEDTEIDFEQSRVMDINRKMFASSCLKFVAPVDIRDIPIFYISNTCFKISLTSNFSPLQHSYNFLSQLKEQNNLCYILRLEFGISPFESETEGPVTEKRTNSRTSWLEFVDESCKTEDILRFDELSQVLDCCSFLVCAVSTTEFQCLCSGALNSGEEDFIYLAFRLRHPSVLNISALHRLTLRSLKQNGEDPGNILGLIDRWPVADQLKSLISLDTSTFFHLYRTLCQSEPMSSLNESPSDLNFTFKTSSDAGSSAEQSLRNAFPTFCKNLPEPSVPQYCLDPCYQLETKMLMMKAGDLGKSQPFHGTFANLSPPSRSENSVTLDAAEILKYFNPDGTAAEHLRLEKIPRRKSKKRVYLYDRGQNRFQQWPDCSDTFYHDVYYNVGKSEDLEKSCQLLRQRLGSCETASTFVESLALPHTSKRSQTAKSLAGHPNKCTRESLKSRRNSLPVLAMKTRGHIDSKRSAAEKKTKVLPGLDTDAFLDSNSCESNSGLRQESRSQRNKRKLEEVVREILTSTASLNPSNALFEVCFKRLYTITEAFVKDLPTSRGLREEMAKIARSHVQQTIKFEKERQKKLLLTFSS